MCCEKVSQCVSNCLFQKVPNLAYCLYGCYSLQVPFNSYILELSFVILHCHTDVYTFVLADEHPLILSYGSGYCRKSE